MSQWSTKLCGLDTRILPKFRNALIRGTERTQTPRLIPEKVLGRSGVV